MFRCHAFAARALVAIFRLRFRRWTAQFVSDEGFVHRARPITVVIITARQIEIGLPVNFEALACGEKKG